MHKQMLTRYNADRLSLDMPLTSSFTRLVNDSKRPIVLNYLQLIFKNFEEKHTRLPTHKCETFQILMLIMSISLSKYATTYIPTKVMI